MKAQIAVLVLGGLLINQAMADVQLETYGSVRMQAEAVSVSQAKTGQNDSYLGLRDAYSRFGVKVSYPVNSSLSLAAQLEIPFNSAQLKIEDPAFFEGFYRHNSAPRVAKITASGDWGSIDLGKQWLSYYNYVAAPVDQFSSFYSGFATHAAFRRDALTYNSPNINGFNFSISAVDRVDGANSAYLDTMQYGLAYGKDNFKVALGLERQGRDAGNINSYGLALSYGSGPWLLAAKLETLENLTVANQAIKVLFASYNLGQYTIKASAASGDEVSGGGAFFIGDSLHLGLDYQYNQQFKVFAEYFTESNGYAIYTPNTDSFEPLAGYQAKQRGQAVLLGARYDF